MLMPVFDPCLTCRSQRDAEAASEEGGQVQVADDLRTHLCQRSRREPWVLLVSVGRLNGSRPSIKRGTTCNLTISVGFPATRISSLAVRQAAMTSGMILRSI